MTKQEKFDDYCRFLRVLMSPTKISYDLPVCRQYYSEELGGSLRAQLEGSVLAMYFRLFGALEYELLFKVPFRSLDGLKIMTSACYMSLLAMKKQMEGL